MILELEALRLIAEAEAVVIPVGLPGTGKSTLAERLCATDYLQSSDIISTDDFRVALGGRRNWLEDEDAVFELARKSYMGKLKANRRCYLDATNLNPEQRADNLREALGHGRYVLAVRFRDETGLARGRRLEAGVPYDDEVWNELIEQASGIDWSTFPVPWIDSNDLLRALGHTWN